MLPLVVYSADGAAWKIQAVADTGYQGALLLPRTLVMRRGLPLIDEEKVLLAVGSITRLALHDVILLWNEVERNVAAHAADSVTLEVMDGGTVTVEPLD